MKMAVYRAASSPCSNLPVRYVFMLKFDFERMDITCMSIEIPPKPSKNEHMIIFIDRYWVCKLATMFTPDVSSIIPVNILFVNSFGIYIFSNIEPIALNIFNSFIIDRNTENKTINPPI